MTKEGNKGESVLSLQKDKNGAPTKRKDGFRIRDAPKG